MISEKVSSWFNSLDRVELLSFFFLALTFFGDIASTIYFITQGYANQELNLIIRTLGWGLGSIVVFTINLIAIFLLVHLLKKYRHNPTERFYCLSPIFYFVLFRLLIIIANFSLPVRTGGIAQENISIGLSYTYYIYIAIFVGSLIVMSNILFWLFSRSYSIEYREKK